MFKVRNNAKGVNEAPVWLKKAGSMLDLPDQRALEFANRGWVTLIRHFRVLRVKSICPTCKQKITIKVKKFEGNSV